MARGSVCLVSKVNLMLLMLAYILMEVLAFTVMRQLLKCWKVKERIAWKMEAMKPKRLCSRDLYRRVDTRHRSEEVQPRGIITLVGQTQMVDRPASVSNETFFGGLLWIQKRAHHIMAQSRQLEEKEKKLH